MVDSIQTGTLNQRPTETKNDKSIKFFDSYLKIVCHIFFTFHNINPQLRNMNQLKAILKTNKFKYISSNERCLWFPVDQSIMYVWI